MMICALAILNSSILPVNSSGLPYSVASIEPLFPSVRVLVLEVVVSSEEFRAFQSLDTHFNSSHSGMWNLDIMCNVRDEWRLPYSESQQTSNSDHHSTGAYSERSFHHDQ